MLCAGVNTMSKHTIIFIGLDIHKEFTEIVTINEHRDEQHSMLSRENTVSDSF